MQGSDTTKTDHNKASQILETAMDVFVHFGFQKTSMSEVAKAAGVSRQGLYFHFPTKEALFTAAMEQHIRCTQDRVKELLMDARRPLEDRLLACFDETMGRYAGKMCGGKSDLPEASQKLSGDLIDRALSALEKSLVKVIDETVPGGSKVDGIPTAARVSTLLNSAIGIKHSAKSREEFRESMRLAIHVVIGPLKPGKR